MAKTDKPQMRGRDSDTGDAAELISNIAEAEAYITGFVDGTLVALGMRSQDAHEIRDRCARMREFTDE